MLGNNLKTEPIEPNMFAMLKDRYRRTLIHLKNMYLIHRLLYTEIPRVLVSYVIFSIGFAFLFSTFKE